MKAQGRIITGLTVALGTVDVVFGLWAFLAPKSFFVTVGPFPPFNVHYVHDVGSFLTGLGAGLLYGIRRPTLLAAAAAGNAVAAVVHLVSHFQDTHLGGHSYDIPALIVFALLSLLLLWFTAPSSRQQDRP